MTADYGIKDAVLYVSEKLRCFRNTAKLTAVIFLAQYVEKQPPLFSIFV